MLRDAEVCGMVLLVGVLLSVLFAGSMLRLVVCLYVDDEVCWMF